MSFADPVFLLFLPVTLLLYWLLPFKWRRYWLLAASWFFYGWGGPMFVFIMLFSAVLDYTCGLIITKHRGRAPAKAALLASILVNLGLLSLFKYTDFFISVINGAFGTAIPFLHLPLPIGISFYTFQTMSYTIDVYRGKFNAEKNFLSYALYVSFFPQLVAGPIERADNLLHQFREEKKPAREDFIAGFRFMLFGFFKKICVADLAGSYVNTVFSSLTEASGAAFWMAGMLFTVQIYCDFSGYSDIAMGCARMMGIRLMENFNRPLTAASFRDYGRRWHISLSSWFMEYVYFPLGGSRKGKIRKYLNTLVVFTLSGFWHGANWTFIFWGLFIGLVTCLEDIIRPGYRRLSARLGIDNSNRFVLLLRRCVVLGIVAITSIFFRSRSIGDVGLILSRMFSLSLFSPSGFSSAFRLMGMDSMKLLQLILSLFILDRGYYICRPGKTGLFARGRDSATDQALRLGIYVFGLTAVAALWILAASGNMQSQFIYFQF